MHQPPEKRSAWRRLSRVSVRGIMALVVVLGCGLGWIANRAKVQREAVGALRQAGAWVTYDGMALKKAPGAGPWFRAPKWLIDRVGIDYFSHPVSVFIYKTDPEMLETALTHVGRLDQLESLVVDQQGLTDAKLARIGPMRSLQKLQLGPGKIGDDGLKQIARMNKLWSLKFDGDLVTDRGMAHLANLHDLQFLTLSGPEITDEGISHLGGLSRLKNLTICNTKMTNAGLMRLQSLPNLVLLRLYQNLEVDGVGIDALQQKMPGVKIHHEF